VRLEPAFRLATGAVLGYKARLPGGPRPPYRGRRRPGQGRHPSL